MNATSAAELTGALRALTVGEILNSLADGAYITDVNRNILFWNASAERMTGWRAAEVVGRSCFDKILCHVDKDGWPLCGEEHRPLHRAIVTGQPSGNALLVFALSWDGKRVPVEVSVIPIHDATGRVMGGIELFRDLTAEHADLIRARLIQEHALASPLPADDRVALAVRYVPAEIVGGEFYRVERIDADRYAFLRGGRDGARSSLSTVHHAVAIVVGRGACGTGATIDIS